MSDIISKNTIKSLRKFDRPREKLLKYGVESLDDYQLLAILIDTGTKEKNAIEIAKELIEFAGSIDRLAKFDVNMLKQIKGIGIAKASKIVVSIEFAKRVVYSKKNKQLDITNPQDAVSLFSYEFESLNVEVFKLICLNTKNNIIYTKNITTGIVNASLVTPREVYKEAILRHSSSIIVMHNHPSKNPNPSPQDIEITKNLFDAGNIMGIEMLDHIIYGTIDNYYSFKKSGYLN